MERRIIELALEALQARKASIQAEIDRMRGGVSAAAPIAAAAAVPVAAKEKRQRTMTAAQRKAVSKRMKRYWKEKRAKKA